MANALLASLNPERAELVYREWSAYLECEQRLDVYAASPAWKHHGIPDESLSLPSRAHFTQTCMDYFVHFMAEGYAGPVGIHPEVAEVLEQEPHAWLYDECSACRYPLPLIPGYARGGKPMVEVPSHHFFTSCPYCGGPVQFQSGRPRAS